MVLKSDNVAANILLGKVTMASVNTTAHALGFGQTWFRRKLLDTAAQTQGVENLTSAQDLAGMVDQIARGRLLSPVVSQTALALLVERGDHDKDWLGKLLPPGATLAHINGTLDGVRNDVGLITAPSGAVVRPGRLPGPPAERSRRRSGDQQARAADLRARGAGVRRVSRRR